ncbi:GNAT family N-acetyltransferase [Noviherbaspirillum galbum]|uniref:GNAT family N-acetyltransferase n=1 Tax=Noviherbaspirillum galbum TaxID=2709383 RepID=A0A6B3SZE2_9BURK|nr:GNAT family N-acetyltransferase [Noviherbaspirillum galbum]NEX64642.1 GNAT family N-acetyltransferase [Noviherbaspirillum galbum]
MQQATDPVFNFLQRFERWSKPGLFAIACLLELAIFSLDHLTGPLIPFGPYYFLPIGVAAWFLGLPSTMAFVVLSSLGRTYIFGHLFPSGDWHYYVWDLLSSLLIYAAFAMLLRRLKSVNHAIGLHASQLESQMRVARHRRRLEDSIRRAVPPDLDMILDLMVAGATTGDLTPDVVDNVRQQASQDLYVKAIRQGNVPRRTWTNQQAEVPVELWVCDLNGKLAGLFMVMGLDREKDTERELHAIVTAQEFRGLGIGTAMVDFFCSHYYGRRLYAACKPGSAMYQMLKRRGFFHYADTNEGYEIVERVEWPKEKGLLAAKID